MKKLQVITLVALLLLCNNVSKAQLSTGANGFLVAAGTLLFVDSFALQPTADLSLVNVNFTKSSSPVTSANGNSISRVYNFSQPLNITGTIGFAFSDAELNGNTAANLAFVYQLSSDNSFVTSTNSQLNLPGRSITQVLTETPISSVTAVNSGITLPVLLGIYSARADGRRTKIEWSTFSEQNNDRFEVERSTNGADYVTIATVKSRNAGSEQTYVTYDNSPAEGHNYYRLMQYDKDGTKRTFGIKAVVFNVLDEVSVVAYPNPAVNALSFKLHKYTGQQVDISIFSMNGLLLHNEKINTPAGQTVFPIKIKSMPASGDYLLKVKGVKGLNETLKISIL